jgi:hypothetical protein
VYIVSDKRMYRLSADRTGRPHIDREMSYRNSGIPKPSQVDAGSGTTPTIPPGGLVAITDNANPMDAVVYRTATRLRHHQHRVVCQVPVFAKSASASENSLIGSGRSLSVENNYGYQDPFGPHTGAIIRPGFARADINKHVNGCGLMWTNHTESGPPRGYQSSPRQPRLDRALGASASGANQPRAHGSTSPPPRLSPPPLSCHLARSRETAPPEGRSSHHVDRHLAVAGCCSRTAMGSVWRALSFGFGGLRPVGDALAIDPLLPPGWESIEQRVRFRDSRVRVRIREGSVEASADPPARALNPAGEHVELNPASQTFHLSPSHSRRTR